MREHAVYNVCSSGGEGARVTHIQLFLSAARQLDFPLASCAKAAVNNWWEAALSEAQ
jgi:hypothetical protein